MGGNLMRTVTFADAELTDAINRSLVSVWHNQNPTLGKGTAAMQPQPTAQQVSAYPLGGGGGNLRTYFVTPKGQIVHYVQGYWPASHLRDEIRFALEQFESIKGRARIARRQSLVSSLDKRIATIGSQQATLTSSFPSEFTKPIRLSQVRQRHAALGLKVASYNLAKNLAGQDIEGILAMLLQQNLQLGIFK